AHRLADAFRLGSVLAFALAAYALTLPHTPPARRAGGVPAPLAALRLLRDRAFAVYWLCAFGVCVTLPFYPQGAPLLLRHPGVPPEWVGPTLTLSQSTEVLTLAVLPVILLRLGMRGTLWFGLVAWTLLLALLTLGRPAGLIVAALGLNGVCICCY